ncbi:MAG: tetratricopeptide repeat protein [Bacteroidia bacterium]|nr:tetratricopeptide repeat protein [Bacteroidia bacterium]
MFSRLFLKIIFLFLGGNCCVYAQQANSGPFQIRIRNHPSEVLVDVQDQLAAESDSLSLGKLYLLKGRCMWQMGKYDSANVAFFSALTIAQRFNDDVLLASSWQGLAAVSWRYANFDQAMDYVLRSWKLIDKMPGHSMKPEAMFWLGAIHADLRQYHEALRYYHQGIHWANAVQDSLELGELWNMVGRAHRKQRDYDSARIAHRISLPYYQALGDSLGISDYLNNVGSIFRREGRFDSAITYFQAALRIQLSLHDQEGLADGYNDIGTTFSQMGRFREAFRYLNLGLEVARSTGLRDDVRYAYASLAATFDSVGDYRNALRYYRLESILRDSLLQEEISRRADVISMISENEQQQAEIVALHAEELHREVRSRKISLIFLSILGVFLLILAFVYWRNQLARKQKRELAYKNRQIQREKKHSEDLLLNIFPASIAEEMMANGKAQPRELEHVTVMFVDFVGFSSYASGRSPRLVVKDLQTCFEAFDHIITEHGIEKIKTIGDAYMCAGGVPEPQARHELQVVRAALKIQDFMESWIEGQKALGEPHYEARIGIHSGPVVAGVVGLKKYTYDIWGNTVNIAARMESGSDPGRVNISGDTYRLVHPYFICRPRGQMKIKNLGEIDMYFVDWAV